MPFTLGVSAIESVCCVACTEGSRQLILCLVRPMQRTFVAFALITAVVTSSVASPYVYSPQPGPKYRLSSAELAEIDRLVAKRRDIVKPVDAIGMLAPDYAQVSSGAPQRNGDLTSWFHIRKKNGKWTIEERRAATTRAVFAE